MILSGKELGQKKYSRIISLVPSQTELLAYLRFGERSNRHYQILRSSLKSGFSKKQGVGGTKNINLQKIDQLSPDLIIANKEENVKEQIESWLKNMMCGLLM